jgi:2,5-diketo-D-gluconate reductase B
MVMNHSMIGPMPQIGFGTWNRVGDEAQRTTLWALEAGYRLIDTAEGYGNETEVGRAIAGGDIPREDIFLTTKVAPENLGPGQIRPHVEASLDRLGVEHVDLLLLHYPSIGDEYEMEDYVGQLAEVHDARLTTHIGVSNFTKRHIDRAQELLGDRPITTNQVEIHIFMQNRPIVEHCRAKGIPLTAYSPLARGAVADELLISRIAEVHDATPSQVALAFLLAEGHAVIPSSGDRGRIQENFAAQELELDEDEMEALRGLDRGMRLVDGPWCPEWDT